MKTTTNNFFSQPVYMKTTKRWFYLETFFSLLSLALILIIAASALSMASAESAKLEAMDFASAAIKANLVLILAAAAANMGESASRAMMVFIPAERVSIRDEEGAES